MHITEMIWLSQMSNLEINMVVHFSRYLSCLGEPSHTQEGNMTTTSMVHNHGASVLIGHLRKDSHAIFSLRVPLLCAYHQLALKMMLAMSWGKHDKSSPISAVDEFTTMGPPQKCCPVCFKTGFSNCSIISVMCMHGLDPQGDEVKSNTCSSTDHDTTSIIIIISDASIDAATSIVDKGEKNVCSP